MSANENQIVVYQPNETVRLDVHLENDTVWLNRHQMAQLFGRDIKTIGKHIANALSEELASDSVVSDITTAQHQQNSVVAKFATTAADGKVYQVEYYSLDVVLSVGYRVKSVQGILFRRWANTVLKEYKPIEISEEGLELIEFLSVDCTATEGEWHSDSELKIDRNGFLIVNGNKTKDFWDGRILSEKKPLRLKIRNICGDETIWEM